MSVSSVTPTSSSRYVTFDKTPSASKFQVQETKSDNRQPVLLDEGVFGTAFVGEPPVPIKMDKYGIDLWYSGGSKNAGNGRYYIQQGVANYTADSTDEDPTVAIYGINDYGEEYSEIVHLNDIDPTNATYGEFNALYQHIAETSSPHISPNGTFFAIDTLESMHFQYDKKYNFLAQLDLMSKKYQGIHDYRDVSQIQDMKTALINNFNEKNSQGIKAGDNPGEPIFYASDIENSQSGVSLETAGEYSKMIQKIEKKIDKEQNDALQRIFDKLHAQRVYGGNDRDERLIQKKK